MFWCPHQDNQNIRIINKRFLMILKEKTKNFSLGNIHCNWIGRRNDSSQLPWFWTQTLWNCNFITVLLHFGVRTNLQPFIEKCFLINLVLKISLSNTQERCGIVAWDCSCAVVTRIAIGSNPGKPSTGVSLKIYFSSDFMTNYVRLDLCFAKFYFFFFLWN
jgi:hypothetical protein